MKSILDGGTNVPIALQNIANPDLTWETTEQLNFGADFTTTNGKISGTIDIYEKRTKDLLQNVNIPTSSGFSNILNVVQTKFDLLSIKRKHEIIVLSKQQKFGNYQ